MFKAGFDDVDLDDRGQQQGRQAGKIRDEQAEPETIADAHSAAFVLELGPRIITCSG
jgi:hypothetical protein